jgi:glutaredoxin 2
MKIESRLEKQTEGSSKDCQNNLKKLIDLNKAAQHHFAADEISLFLVSLQV